MSFQVERLSPWPGLNGRALCEWAEEPDEVQAKILLEQACRGGISKCRVTLGRSSVYLWGGPRTVTETVERVEDIADDKLRASVEDWLEGDPGDLDDEAGAFYDEWTQTTAGSR